MPDRGRGGEEAHVGPCLVAGAVLVALNVCVIGSLEVLVGNRAEFRSAGADLLPLFAAAAVMVALLLAGMGFLVPRRWRAGYAAAVFTAGVLTWAQSAFLMWEYGEFDGQGIAWSAYPWQGWVDTALWAGALGTAVRFRRRVLALAGVGATVLIMAQAALLWPRVSGVEWNAPPGGAASDESRLPEEMSRLSLGTNVFHIIMDSYQTDVFMELVEEEALASSLSGFTVFRENISAGGRTVLSVPSLFSTNVYDGSQSESEYFRRASSGSFVLLLAEDDYEVNFIAHIPMAIAPGSNYFATPARYDDGPASREVRDAAFLLDISAFRASPHFLRRVLYNDQNWRLSAAVGAPPAHLSFHHKAFFADYTRCVKVGLERNAYHFIHLMPPHPPFVTREDGSYAGKTLPHTWENYKNEARHALRLFEAFLDRLRELGVYDRSLILLHGDHGVGMAPRIGGSPATERMRKVAALLLLKPPSATGPLNVSDAQTSLTDIPPTVMEILGIEHPYPGQSILELEPGVDRARRVIFVSERSSREPVVSRYVINGSAFDAASWHALEPTRVEYRVRDYEWGRKLRFGISGDGDGYLTEGWSTTSPTVHWNDGHSARLTLGIPDVNADVVFEVEFFPYVVPGKVDRQRLQATANGHRFDAVECASPAPLILRQVVPAGVVKGGELVIDFAFPDAVSPKDIGEGRDSRKLAMGLYSFVARPLPRR